MLLSLSFARFCRGHSGCNEESPALQPEALADVDDEILYIGDDSVRCEGAAVSQFVDREFGNIDTVEVNLAHRAVGKYAIGRSHVAGCDGVKHRGHADDGGRLPDLGTHGILRLVHVSVDWRKRAVVTDRARENVGNMIFLTVVDDAVVDVFLLDELPDAAVVSDPVDGVEMIVMPEWLAFLRVDILAVCRYAPSRSCVASAFPASTAFTYPPAMSLEKAFLASESNAKAGPITQTTYPCSFS